LPVVDVLAEAPVPEVPVEPLADDCVSVVEPCVATWPWLPAALCVPSTEPCAVVPVFDAVFVSLLDPEHPTKSAAAPSAVMT